MPIAAALGANLWMVAVAVPLLLGHAGWGSLVAFIAPALLAWGALGRVPGVLLLAFPVAALLPTALFAGGEPTARLMPPAPWPLLCGSLLAYIVAASRALAPAQPAAPDADRALPKEEVPSRWRRRRRIYAALAAAACLFPVALVAQVGAAPLEKHFPGRAAAAQTFLVVMTGFLWALLYRGYLLQPLQGHLQQDRDVLAGLEERRRQARRGRPRPAFYFFVVMALAAMAAVVLSR